MAGLYIHIPFCAKRCIHCDFFSNTDMSYKTSYLEALVKEMQLRKDYLSDSLIKTIYLGGGTPSQLSPGDLRQLLDAVYRNFSIGEMPEITLEVNPDDITQAYIKELRKLPVNRISMGIQSFQDDELKFLNRRHTSEQAIQAVKNLQANGYTNISIDLIYGLPNQSRANWSANVMQALALQVPHISAYHLMYEEGTTLYRLKEQGKVIPTHEEDSLEAFHYLITTLRENGYQQYEISNFARPGFIARHNSSYWTGAQYLGLGPSAHSYNGINRQWNISSLPDYIKGIAKNKPVVETEQLNPETCYNDLVITGLRTSWGLDLTTVKERFGTQLSAYCYRQAQKYIQQNLMIEENSILTLTPEGIFISDTIMSDLLWVP
ncbi:MAG: radical SAM family heme chaperone HemW [Tannerellaceae bacterium]|nr:radical SAM family heme chaperone HemW [Tannerellaceae bacterium]